MSSICTDHSSLKARVAQASLFGSSHSPLYEKSLLAIEYLQLLSPILLAITFFQNSQETSLPQTILFLARLFNPAYWISFSELDGFKICILVGVFTFIAFKGLLLIWITWRLSRELPVPPFLLKIWRNLFKAHGRVIYYYVTSLLADVIMKSRLNLGEDEENPNKIMLGIFLFFVIAEFVYAMTFSFRYLYVLPTKSFLSAKDNTVEAITLLQKFIIQMLMIFMGLDSLSGLWAFTAINLSADFMRNFFFYKRFPLYSFKALAYQGRFLMIVTSVNIASFVSLIRRSADSEMATLQSVIILWIFLALFLVKLSEESIKKGFWTILSDPGLKDPYLLVHRISAIKQLRKLTKKAFDYNDNYAWSLLANKTLNENLKAILKIDNETAGFQTKTLDINSRDCADLMFKSYLERLAESFPENQIFQLLLAQFKVKNLKIYGDAVRISKNIEKNGNSPFLVLNAELLLIEIQSIIHHNSVKENNPERPFDAVSFMKQQSIFAEIKLSMLEQAKLQIKICNEIKKDTPNLAFISNNSQVLNTLKKRIAKKMNNFLQQEVSEQNIEPLLLNAQYHLALNHSFVDYVRFIDQYIQKSQKSQKYFSQEALSQQNVFQNNVGYYFLSGQKLDSGNIVFSSKPGGRIFLDTNMQSGTNMAERAPPCLRPIYAAFYKRLSEDATDTYLNKVIRAFSYLREEDCLVEVEYNLSIHPYATQGFYYIMIFRKVESNRGSMYIHENGDIEAATGDLKKKLNMKQNRCENSKPIYNIKDLSEELVRANEIFNKIALPEKYQKSNEKMDEIYATYSGLGRDIFLKPFHQDQEILSYNVKITNQTFGPLLLKVFTFEENIKQNKPKQRISTRRKTTKILTPHNLSTFGKEASPRSPRLSPTQASEYYIPDDEKGNGWINIEALTSRKTSATTRRDQATCDENNTTRCFFPSPVLPKEDSPLYTFEDAAREFHARGGRQRSKNSTDLIPDSGFTGLGAKQEGKSNEVHDDEEESYITSMNNSSTFSQKKKLANIYQTSINSKHSPKIYKITCVLFFLMLIVFFIAEILFLAIIDKNTQELKVKKDILRNFQYRNFISICIEGFIRIMWELNSGSLTFADVEIFPAYYGLFPYYSMASVLLTALATANSELQSDASLLKEGLNELLFRKDIPIYNTYFGEFPETYEDLNTFQAIDMIVQTGQSIIKADSMQSDEVQEACRFIFRNNLNDVLMKNQVISDQLTALLDSQRSLIENNIQVYYLFKGLAIFFGLMAFMFLIWRQYRKEEKNLSALCRINTERLNKVLKGCEEFKESIEEQTTLTHDFRFLLRKSDEEEKNTKKGPAKRELSKVPDSQGLHKKYYFYVVKYFLLMAVFGGMVTTSSVLAGKNVNAFQKEQDQIYFIDYMRARTTLCFAASRELFNTNNTAMIENTIILDEYSALLTQFSALRVEVYSTLLDSKTVDNNPTVKTAILEDFCEIYSSSSILLPCQLLASYGIERNLIYLLGIFENTLKEQFDDYVYSGKTEAELVEIRTNKIGLTLATFMVLVSMTGTLSGIINDELDLEINSSHQSRIIGCGFWVTVIVIIGIIGWVTIIKKMKESVNNFKNVLKVLPGDVIFSSFILKTFLIKTTKSNIADLNKISRSMM